VLVLAMQTLAPDLNWSVFDWLRVRVIILGSDEPSTAKAAKYVNIRIITHFCWGCDLPKPEEPIETGACSMQVHVC